MTHVNYVVPKLESSQAGESSSEACELLILDANSQL